MIFEGIIESVSSVTEGISKKNNTPYRSCTITMAEDYTQANTPLPYPAGGVPAGASAQNSTRVFHPQRIWATAMNDNCQLVQDVVNNMTMSDGRINGVYRATLRAKVREWTDSKGNLRKTQELRLVNLEAIG